MSTSSKSKDVFAEIAAQRAREADESLIEPAPPVLPDRVLPSTRHNPKAIFKPKAKLDTPEKLQKELARQRKRHEKFMADLAPQVESKRIAVDLQQFDWREATAEDHKDFLGVLQGQGQWEKVQIPHYGGPLGRAVTLYRTTFEITAEMLEQEALFVCFKGVDYKAHVFVNDAYVGSHEGFFAPFEFEFTQTARQGENTLVVKVENDAVMMGNASWDANGTNLEGDKIYAATGVGYDDPQVGWHHCPPGMGIYQSVTVEARSRLSVYDIFVRPVVEENRAEAWIEVFNTTHLQEDISLELSVFGQNFRKTVLKNHRCDVQYAGPGVNYYRISFDMPNARIWDLGTPWLYQIQVRVLDKDDNLCDVRSRQFGMRTFRLDEDCEPKGRFYLNDREIRLRGANTMGHLQQCVVKEEWDQLRDDILLAKICNMNFLRLTQRPVQPEIYEYCDRLGLMVQTDLPLFGVLRHNQFCEAVRQSQEMERLVRSHACNIMVTYINEPFPNSYGRPQRHLSRKELEDFFTAANLAIRVANPDRVIKPVDGDYNPPAESLPDNHCYNTWYNGHGLQLGKLIKGYWQKVKPGWNYGCGEFGAEGLEAAETMYKYYPKEWLPATPDEDWSPTRIVKAQTGRFHYMWYATQRTLPQWVRRSQEFQEWAVRTMTEAFRRDNRMVTFAIHLFIDAFPSGWMKTIMDVDRNAKPAFFAYMDALSPIAANLRTDRLTYFGGENLDMELWVCNDRNEVPCNCKVRYQVRQGRKVLFAQQTSARMCAVAAEFQGFLRYQLPDVTTRTEFEVQMAIVDDKGGVIHDTAKTVTVFPKQTLPAKTISVLGEKSGAAWRLVKQLGCKPRKFKAGDKDVIVADSIAALEANREELEDALKQGARVVVTDLNYEDPRFEIDPRMQVQPWHERRIDLEFAGAKLRIEPGGMNMYMYANSQTSHPLVEGMQPDDFFAWHDAKSDTIEPFLPLVIRSDDLAPVLLSGNGTWDKQEWEAVLAAGEKDVHDGKLLVSCVRLLNKTATNPIARLYAARLLGLE